MARILCCAVMSVCFIVSGCTNKTEAPPMAEDQSHDGTGSAEDIDGRGPVVRLSGQGCTGGQCRQQVRLYPQYADLQPMTGTKIGVPGFPANNFGNQEP